MGAVRKVTRWHGRPLLDLGEIARLYESGLSTREVGRRVGCSPHTVLRACRERGVVTREVGDKEGKAWRNRRDRRRGAKGRHPWLSGERRRG